MPSFMVIKHVTDHVTNAGTKARGASQVWLHPSPLQIDMESIKELKLEKIRKNISHIHLTNGKRVVLLAEVGV